MGNPLPENMTTGTLGELLTQIKLLEFGVQAAPPIKDTGNDLIAIKGRTVKFIQVKTSLNRTPSPRDLPEVYDFVLLVNLNYENNNILLDRSTITVEDSDGNNLGYLTKELVDTLWV